MNVATLRDKLKNPNLGPAANANPADQARAVVVWKAWWQAKGCK